MAGVRCRCGGDRVSGMFMPPAMRLGLLNTSNAKTHHVAEQAGESMADIAFSKPVLQHFG